MTIAKSTSVIVQIGALQPFDIIIIEIIPCNPGVTSRKNSNQSKFKKKTAIIFKIGQKRSKFYFKVSQGQFYFISCHLPERIEMTHARSMPVSQFSYGNNCLRA